MSMWAELVDRSLLPRNSVLFFWVVVQSFAGDNTTHVAAFDEPTAGGWDESETMGQMLCTMEYINLDLYGIKGGRLKDEYERVESVSCNKCREKILQSLMLSGIIAE